MCVVLLGACHPSMAAVPAVKGVVQPAVRVITTDQEGLYQWDVLNGAKLTLIVGTLAHVDSVKQSMTFYLQPRTTKEMLHVTIKEAKNQYAVSFMSDIPGEDAVSDAVTVVRGNQTYLIVARPDGRSKWLAARTYKLIETGPDAIAEPTYMFDLISINTYDPKKSSLADVLKTEVQRQPLK